MTISNVARITTKLQIAEIYHDRQTADINGIKASKQDMHQLEQDVKAGKVRICGRMMEGGDISFITEG